MLCSDLHSIFIFHSVSKWIVNNCLLFFLTLYVAIDDDIHMSDENETEISIGTEIPDQEPMDDAQSQEMLPAHPSEHEASFTSPLELHMSNNHGKHQLLILQTPSCNFIVLCFH